MADPVVSVIIVTWNSASVIPGCLESLRDGLGELETEIIVVDNASTDGTVQTVLELEPDARVIRNSTNRGLAAANNQGLEESRGAWLLICNPDVLFRPGAVGELMATMQRHPRAAWVVPRLLYEDGSLQTSAGDLPTLAESLLGRQLNRKRSPGDPAGFWWDGWAHDEERVIGRGHECAYLVRRQAYQEVGPQDERYVLDWEGLDWTDRFRRAGWEIWLAPAAAVVHLGGNSIRQVPFRWVASQHRGMYLYYSTRRRPAWKPLLGTAFAVRAALKMGLIAAGIPMYKLGHRAESSGTGQHGQGQVHQDGSHRDR